MRSIDSKLSFEVIYVCLLEKTVTFFKKTFINNSYTHRKNVDYYFYTARGKALSWSYD